MSLVFVMFMARALAADEPPLEFSGVLTTDGHVKLALTDKATSNTQWVEAGDEFGGYSVARYDAKEDAVFLKKGGHEYRLALVPEKTTEAPRTSGLVSGPPRSTGTPPSAAPNPTVNAIRSNLRTLAAAARQYQLQHGVTNVTLADLVGPDKFIKELVPVAGENYSTLSFAPNVTAVSVTTADGTTVTLDVPPAIVPPRTESPAPALAATGTAPPAPAPAETLPAAAAPAASSALAAASSNPATTPATTGPTTSSASEALSPTGRQPPSPSYVIQGGDTLETIAQRNGVTVQQVRDLNPTLNPSSLPAGQTIRIR